MAPVLGHTSDAIAPRGSRVGPARILAKSSDGKPGVEGEGRCQRPAANDRVHAIIDAAAKHLALAERQIVDQIAVEQPCRVGDASSVVAVRVVSILEEEGEPGLAGRARKPFFVSERTKRAQAVVHAFGPGVVGAELESLPGALLQADLQRVVALNAAGVVVANGRRVAGTAAVDQRLREWP